jgi:hypothetical protein
MWGGCSCGSEQFCHLTYNVVESVERQPIFRRNMLPLSSESTDMPSKIPRCECCLLLDDFLPGLFFSPGDGGDFFLRKVDLPSADYTSLSRKTQIFRNRISETFYPFMDLAFWFVSISEIRIFIFRKHVVDCLEQSPCHICVLSIQRVGGSNFLFFFSPIH